MNKIFIFITVAVFITGCSLKDVSKPIARYDVYSATKAKSKTRSDKVLRVARFRTPANLFSKKIWYQREDMKTNSYLYSTWSLDFSTMIEQQVANTLYASKLFKSVLSDYSKAKVDLVLEGEIVKAVQRVGTNGAEVVFEVRLYLINYKTSKLIGSKDFLYTKKCESVDAQGAIKAYGKIMKIFNKEVILWLEKLVIKG